MKKVQAMDEAGRAMAQERYGEIPNKSKHGHAQIDHNMAGKFDDGGTVKPPSNPTPPDFDSPTPTGPDHDPWNMGAARLSGDRNNIDRVRGQVLKYKWR